VSHEAANTVGFCTNCGKELQKGAKFCAFCGTQVLLLTEPSRDPTSLSTETPAAAALMHKPSFFGRGRARKPVLFLLWAVVLALAFEQLYHDWAGTKPPTQHGPGMVFWAGVLAAMYAPKRRFFGVLWFFLGVIGSLFAIGVLSGFMRVLR
jgi:zinc-ribbon domain